MPNDPKPRPSVADALIAAMTPTPEQAEEIEASFNRVIEDIRAMTEAAKTRKRENNAR